MPIIIYWTVHITDVTGYRLGMSYTYTALQYMPAFINTELNNLRKIVCQNLKFFCCQREFQFVLKVIENLAEHGIHCLPCSYINDVINRLV